MNVVGVLVLEQMYAPAIAEQLRRRGHDAESVLERDDLIGLPDAALWEAAQTDRRVVVTENVVDFVPLHSEYARTDRPHAGLVLTTNAKFPRGARGSVGALVKALDATLSAAKAEQPEGFVRWL